MAQKPVSKELMQQAVDTLARHGGNITNAAGALGVPQSTLRNRLLRAEEKGVVSSVGDPNAPEQLRLRLRRAEAELAQLRETKLDEDTLRNTLFELKAKVTTATTPAWALEVKTGATSPGVPTLFLSDLHWGEVVNPAQINGVNRYDMLTAKARLLTAVESTVNLLGIISPAMDYPGVVLALGGDMISGNIHDELTATNELNTMPTVLDLFGNLEWIIAKLAEHFGKVFVSCVSGNHGRDTHKIWNKDRHATSFDWLLYCFLAKRFENDSRVTFLIPDGPDAYYRVYGHRYLLTHGDQFRGGDGMIGALGPIIRGDHKKRSRNAQVDMEYDTLLMGHFHQYIHLNRLIVNGSLKGYDEYAYNNNFAFEPPQQALWLTHPKYRITYRMPVYVDRVQKAPKTEWIEVPKK